MSDSLEQHAPLEPGGDTEEVDAVVVVPSETAVVGSRALSAVVPAIQAAAVVATGFVAGAATAGLVRRGRERRAVARSVPGRRVNRGGGRGRRSGEYVQIVGSRSLLVDVHLLGAPGRGR